MCHGVHTDPQLPLSVQQTLLSSRFDAPATVSLRRPRVIAFHDCGVLKSDRPGLLVYVHVTRVQGL